MPTRRTFIRTGIAATAVAATPLGAWPRTERSPQTEAVETKALRQSVAVPFKVVFDRNVAGAAAFADAVAALGHPVEAVGADVGRLWRDAIEPRLRVKPAAIAGLTAGAPLFCLELLARDYGLRTVYRVEHARLADGRLQHVPEGVVPVRSVVESPESDRRWLERMGTLVATHFPRVGSGGSLELLDLAGRPGRAETLFTWMLAPR